MATLDWPAGHHFSHTEFRLSLLTPKNGFTSPYTGQMQTISLLADRWRIALRLPLCYDPQAGEREAFFAALASTGDWVRLWHMQRPEPMGTLRGTPTVGTAAIAGARTLTVLTTPGATLLPGDMLGATSQLLQCAYPGATANGSGVLQMPLTRPLQRAVAANAALTWNKPTGTFQLLSMEPSFSYVNPRLQSALDLTFGEVFA